jgi:glutathione synthase/RimK-type ligase-like ATP-grasp enzyme
MARSRKRSLPLQYFDTIPLARQVALASRKPLLAQFVEMLRLWQLPNRISPDEYFSFRLFDDARLSWEAKRRFLGRRAKPHVYALNQPSWRALAEDKLASLAHLAAFKLPVASILAVFAPGRVFPGARSLRDLADVADFLRREAPYPLFSKPNTGTLGRGAFALAGIDTATDELLLTNGRRLALSAFLAETVAMNRDGTIFQELIKPHPLLRDICGDRLSTVRALVLNGPGGATVHRAVWRIPVGSNMVDNFRHGGLGNLLAGLTPADGRVSRVISGTGLQMQEIESHPDTGRPFNGVALPEWDRLIEICLRAGAVMNGMRIQGWDVALSDRGPLLMEVNFLSDLDLTQLAEGQGVADDDWHRFIEACRQPS